MSASERRIAELEAEVGRLRHLLSQQMRTGEALEVEAIVNQNGTPLLNLRWDKLAAQVPIEDGRRLAFQMLRSCEWAETDAKLYAFMRREEFDNGVIRGFMAMLREGRGGKADAAG